MKSLPAERSACFFLVFILGITHAHSEPWWQTTFSTNVRAVVSGSLIAVVSDSIHVLDRSGNELFAVEGTTKPRFAESVASPLMVFDTIHNSIRSYSLPDGAAMSEMPVSLADSERVQEFSISRNGAYVMYSYADKSQSPSDKSSKGLRVVRLDSNLVVKNIHFDAAGSSVRTIIRKLDLREQFAVVQIKRELVIGLDTTMSQELRLESVVGDSTIQTAVLSAHSTGLFELSSSSALLAMPWNELDSSVTICRSNGVVPVFNFRLPNSIPTSTALSRDEHCFAMSFGESPNTVIRLWKIADPQRVCDEIVDSSSAFVVLNAPVVDQSSVQMIVSAAGNRVQSYTSACLSDAVASENDVTTLCYPNPSSGELYLRVGSSSGLVRVEILSTG